MDFSSELKIYQEKISTELDMFFSKKLRQAADLDPQITGLIRKVREFNLRGGKRIRPILVIIGYRCLRYKKNEISQLIRAALAVELMESFLLIHDDIIDNDSLRRGKPTLHKLYEKENSNKDYGKNMALLAGDLLAVFGSEAILNTGFDHKLKAGAVKKFNNIVVNTIFGQTLDYTGNFTRDFSESYIKRVHMLKTAKYTVEGPLHIGAILAGAKQKHLDRISEFAIPIGQAFQIKDDILNIFGDQEKLGKPVASDIKEGKKTLLIAKALENSNLKQRLYIKSCLRNKSLKPKQLEKLKNIIISTASLDYSNHLAESLINQAKLSIKSSGFRKQAKQFLLNLADYIINRDK